MAVEKLTFEMNAVGNAVPEMQKVQRQIANVNTSMSKATASMTRHANANRGLSRSLQKTTRGMGMLGLQVQDVAVQASMGTDALRIFSMQGPQIFSLFGPLGMIAGAFAGVGAGVLMASGGLERFSGAFSNLAPVFDNFIDKMGVLLRQFEPLTTFVSGILTGAFRMLGNVIDFVSDNIAALAVVAGTFVAIKLGSIAFTAAQSFVSLAKAISATKILMGALNAVTRKNPILFIAIAAGVAADRLGLITAAMDEMKEKFPEFFDAVGDAGDATNKLITESFKELNAALRTPLQITVDDKASDQIQKITSGTSRMKTAFDMAKERATNAGDMIGRSFENAFMSMMNGTMKAKDAFRVMAAEIISELFRIFVVKRITGFISNMFTFALGPQTGNTGSLGLPSFNNGGYTGNGARAGGLDGKGGFMAMMHPRETVVDHTKDATTGGVVVQQTINVSTGVQQTVRNEIQTLLPQIAEASKAAVLDARRRGGSFANAF